MSDIDFSEYVYYDETSPSGLRWKVDVMSGKYMGIKGMSAGDVAGCINQGYWKTSIKGRKFLNHRVVLALHGHDIAGKVADHLDGVCTNNVISNLRLGTQLDNVHNSRMSKANTSGVCGVFWQSDKANKDGSVRTYAIVTWREGGQQKAKCFSVRQHGLLPAFSKAVSYRESVIARLNSLGAKYSERHGQA